MTPLLIWTGSPTAIYRLPNHRMLQHFLPNLPHHRKVFDAPASHNAVDYPLVGISLALFARELDKHPDHADQILSVIEESQYLETPLRMTLAADDSRAIISPSPVLQHEFYHPHMDRIAPSRTNSTQRAQLSVEDALKAAGNLGLDNLTTYLRFVQTNILPASLANVPGRSVAIAFLDHEAPATKDTIHA